MKNILLFVLVTGAVGAGVWYYKKNKKQGAVPGKTEGDTAPAAPTASAETEAFNALSAMLENDPVWKQPGKVFPADFYDAVQTEYNAQKAGTGRGPEYNDFGRPGAFMAIVDQWFTGEGSLSPGKREDMWRVYSTYRSTFRKGKILGFTGGTARRMGWGL
jgi:hypothetical protein